VFGFGKKAKIEKAVRAAVRNVEAETDLADDAPIEALPENLRAEAFYEVARAMFRDERYEQAKPPLARALALSPNAIELHQLAASIATELGAIDDAIAAQRRVVEMVPREVAPLAALAGMLIDTEQIDEVIELLRPHRANDPELATRLAEALFVRGENAEALEILDDVCANYDAQMKHMFAGDWQTLKDRADEAHRLRDDVYAELHGREATIELAAAAGKLDANAGVNYRLLGNQLAAKSTRVADVLELEEPDATEARGRVLLDADAGDPRGHVLVGSAQLRRGEVKIAKQTFERACELDGKSFAAFLGFGAAIDHENYKLHRRAQRFATPPANPHLAKIVVDLPALTDAERRVVWASAGPFAPLFPILAERNVTMRVLPIDVRATDVGLFEHIAGERADDDHRSYDAIGGVATHAGAIAKIEGLLDTLETGWTFAHEFAHLAFFHMPAEQSDPLLAIYERAVEIGYANIDYALSNPDELFAVSYTNYLLARYDLEGVPHADDAGVQDALMEYFATVCA
jgi:tetratricopeptide (TPR) repeat protein